MKEKEPHSGFVMSIRSIAFAVILFLTFVGMFSSCEKQEEIEYRSGPDIEGQWKVIGGAYSEQGNRKALDYLHHDIIYDFQKNNVLIVSGETEDIEDYIGHEKGQHYYKVFPIPMAGEDYLPRMIIGADNYGFSFGWIHDYYQGVIDAT